MKKILIKPQMSYCCGSRGIQLSPKFKDEHTRCIFVAMAFVIKLVELTFVAFVLYDLSADAEGQLKFNFTFISIQELKLYNWVIFVAAVLTLIIYSAARCSGAGRGFCTGLVLNIIKTFAITIFCGTLVTFDFAYPYRYYALLVVVTICLVCLGVCLFTTLFEMDVLGKTIYTGLFTFFMFSFLLAHFFYFASFREKYKMGYLIFFAHISIGGGVGLLLGMIMFWYSQELVTGKVVSLDESEYLYACLLF